MKAVNNAADCPCAPPSISLRCELADIVHLVFPQALHIFFAEAPLPNERAEYEGKNRMPVVVLAVDLVAPLTFQLPHVGRLLDLLCHTFGFLDDRIQFLLECVVKGLARDNFPQRTILGRAKGCTCS